MGSPFLNNSIANVSKVLIIEMEMVICDHKAKEKAL